MHARDAGEVGKLCQLKARGQKCVQVLLQRSMVMVRLDARRPEAEVGTHRI